VGAANYRSYVWVNGQKVCEHEGGFTPFDCEVTGLLKDGRNFVVMAVDNTRLADGIPTLQTDWWNYGGLTRDVSLVEVPEQFIDDFDLHLRRGTQTFIEGWVHVEGAAPEAQTTVSIPELNVNEAAKVGTDGRATFQFEASKLEPWSPEHHGSIGCIFMPARTTSKRRWVSEPLKCTAPRFSAPAVRTTMRT
jgi:beta-glucuronidase